MVPPIEVDGDIAMCDGGTCDAATARCEWLGRHAFARADTVTPDLNRTAGGGPLGHPLEYIRLSKVDPTEPAVCKYCGLRFIKKGAH